MLSLPWVKYVLRFIKHIYTGKLVVERNKGTFVIIRHFLVFTIVNLKFSSSGGGQLLEQSFPQLGYYRQKAECASRISAGIDSSRTGHSCDYFYWPGMSTDISMHVSKCQTCQENGQCMKTRDN